jgi:hypothetical protein
VRWLRVPYGERTFGVMYQPNMYQPNMYQPNMYQPNKLAALL